MSSFQIPSLPSDATYEAFSQTVPSQTSTSVPVDEGLSTCEKNANISTSSRTHEQAQTVFKKNPHVNSDESFERMLSILVEMIKKTQKVTWTELATCFNEKFKLSDKDARSHYSMKALVRLFMGNRDLETLVSKVSDFLAKHKDVSMSSLRMAVQQRHSYKSFCPTSSLQSTSKMAVQGNSSSDRASKRRRITMWTDKRKQKLAKQYIKHVAKGDIRWENFAKKFKCKDINELKKELFKFFSTYIIEAANNSSWESIEEKLISNISVYSSMNLKNDVHLQQPLPTLHLQPQSFHFPALQQTNQQQLMADQLLMQNLLIQATALNQNAISLLLPTVSPQPSSQLPIIPEPLRNAIPNVHFPNPPASNATSIKRILTNFASSQASELSTTTTSAFQSFQSSQSAANKLNERH